METHKPIERVWLLAYPLVMGRTVVVYVLATVVVVTSMAMMVIFIEDV